jgi:acyl-CoA dehydrogenase
MPRDVFKQMGALGVLGMAIPEEYGGAGMPDYRYNVVLQEEAARALVTLSTVRTQLEVILPYFLHYANDEQRSRWLPGLASGTLLTAIAMTEPGTGSDLAGMRTTAVRDGDDFIVNGAKTFITGGMQADLVIVVARTATDPDNRRKGLTLLVVEDGMPGFTRGRELEKMGCKVQDTAELSFVDVRVPAANVLGEEGEAFGYLGHNLRRNGSPSPSGRFRRPGRRSQRPSATRRTARRSARPSRRSRTPTSSSPRARRRWRPPRPCWTERWHCTSRVSCRRPMPPGSTVGGRCRPGQLVLHRNAAAGRGPVSAAVRRLRLHDGVPHRPAVHGRRVARIYAGTSEVMKVIIAKSLGL